MRQFQKKIFVMLIVAFIFGCIAFCFFLQYLKFCRSNCYYFRDYVKTYIMRTRPVDDYPNSFHCYNPKTDSYNLFINVNGYVIENLVIFSYIAKLIESEHAGSNVYMIVRSDWYSNNPHKFIDLVKKPYFLPQNLSIRRQNAFKSFYVRNPWENEWIKNLSLRSGVGNIVIWVDPEGGQDNLISWIGKNDAKNIIVINRYHNSLTITPELVSLVKNGKIVEIIIHPGEHWLLLGDKHHNKEFDTFFVNLLGKKIDLENAGKLVACGNYVVNANNIDSWQGKTIGKDMER